MVNINNLNISFGNEVVHKNFSLSVKRGHKLAITGESGRGKTTLLNVLGGFITHYEGDVSVDGIVLSSKTVYEIRSKMAWLPQDTSLNIGSVEELLLAPFGFLQNKENKPTKEAIADIFRAFDLSEELLSKKVSESSGGQKQRVILASCMLLNKPLLLIDEPTSALDNAVKEKVANYILKQDDITVIAVTHDHYWIENSDTVLHIK